ncbi:hypothetical protein MLD38_000357 [Melastoma candidum]|uniref:Uncharacterized protein n=1 Tax=Melastoma candidum TaxID=119954 RepID=A0ACB9SB40_9MYRT|nr:hypothetical protein MLD38_000357 [Melastoma candidum]
MEERKADAAAAVDVGRDHGGGGVVGEPSSRVTSSFRKVGERQVFSVELRPGETTIVSWKKLMKDANKAVDDTKPLVSSASGAPSTAVAASAAPAAATGSALDSRIATGQPGEREMKDAAPMNSFSAVIEKIERLYMGKDSSDEEDLDEVPDDDQYDTEDSFIDDSELDEYFEVDNASIKYDGFFINRGKLECINKPSAPPQQPKKRARKDFQSGDSERGEGLVPNKHGKVRKVGTMKAPPISKPSTQTMGASSESGEDMRQSQNNMSVRKKYGDSKVAVETATLAKVANGISSAPFSESKDIEKQRTCVMSLKASGNMKDLTGSSDDLHNRLHEKVANTQHSGRSFNNIEETEASKRTKEKGTVREVPDLNIPDGRHVSETYKPLHSQRKDASSIRPKTSNLEKAIRDLEKVVVESKMPGTENQEIDITSQGTKRRLPSDVKQKLARVARLAQSNNGKISKELVSRLMSILGDCVQLRTLKRHLKVMVSSGLSAKQEKENRFQQIKKEVFDMVRLRLPTVDSKVQEHQAGASDDFQDFNTELRGIPKRKYEMDIVMEDKICDLYDLYVDGLDEDTGPQVRKLYFELAELWPSGLMDSHGIKRAICRAKERRRALSGKYKHDEEKVKRKKTLLHRTEETAKIEGTSLIPQHHGRENSVADSVTYGSAIKPIPPTSVVPPRVPSPSANVSSERPKLEKTRVSSGGHVDGARLVEASLPKKKTRRKPEVDLNVMPSHSEKRLAWSSQAYRVNPVPVPGFGYEEWMTWG